MTPFERRASLSLAAVFGLRLFGMFVILPVFALHAEGRPGWTLALVGMALGAYGLTHALLQVPFGMLSDRHGRKPMLYTGLAIFAAGSFVCAVAESPWAVIGGRALQGAGAVSSVAIAMAADLTRPSQRTKAMALIGSTIGAAFAISLVAAPFLQGAIGVPGIFAMTGVLCLVAMAVVRWVVPDVPPGPVAARERPGFRVVLRDAELLRLNIGIFVLHAILMALFVVLPGALVRGGLAAVDHWWMYLVVVGAGFVLMLPAVIGPAARNKERIVFVGSVAVLAAALFVVAAGFDRLAALVSGLVIFFAAFNVLEAKLPALVSRAAPPGARGAATGIYSSVQFLGIFAGGALGGAVAQFAGTQAVLAGCLALALAWLAAAWKMGDFAPTSEEEDGGAPAPAGPAPSPRT